MKRFMLAAVMAISISGSTTADQANQGEATRARTLAKAQIAVLGRAVDFYRVKHGVFPMKLKDLVDQNLVQPHAILDPWDKEFQYDAAGKRNQGKGPDIWAVTPAKVTIGNWVAQPGAGQPIVVPLWPNGAPGFETRKEAPEKIKYKGKIEQSVNNVNNPTVTVYLPAKDKASGAAILICPGGGHSVLAIEHEGHNVGKWLADHGIAGFVLKYRLAREKGSPYKIEEHAFQDAQRGLRLIRSKAKEWNVNPHQIGIIGFSAGGDLVLYSSTKSDPGKADAVDLVERESSRPDFQIAVYPAIPKNLNFAKNNPPAFLVCGNQDRQNISEGLATLYLNMKRAGINTELHIYASVGHGFGLRDKAGLRIAGWPTRIKEWMIDLDMMKAAPAP